MVHTVSVMGRMPLTGLLATDTDSKRYSRDIPGGPVLTNLPFDAGAEGSIPDWGTKILHAADQLSLCATTGVQRTVTEDPECCNEDPMQSNTCQ